MHTKNFKFGLAVAAAVLLTLGLSISLQSLLAAWTSPTSAPPNNNIAAPINVSAIAQSKIGSLGIGVTSPDQKFVVQDDTAAVARIRITDTGQNPELQLQYGSDTNNDHWAIYNEQANDSLRIWGGGASGDNRLTILQNGNVGIGTTEPGAKLDLGNSGRIINVQNPVNTQDVATKAYVDAQAGGGCYVSYSGGCLPGFTNKGSAGWWGSCRYAGPGCGAHFRPAGGGCSYGWGSLAIGEAFVCCQ